MARGRVLRPEEARLWHKIAKSTRPLVGKNLEEIEKQFEEIIKQNPIIVPKVQVSKNYQKFVQSHSPNSTPPIADAKQHKKVRRGKLEIDAVLDLHGLTQDVAKLRVCEFVHAAINNNYRTILIITGKGGNLREMAEFDLLVSPRGILRQRLKDWLHEPTLKHHIAGISEAHLKHGGSGAFYVLLKAKHKNL